MLARHSSRQWKTRNGLSSDGLTGNSNRLRNRNSNFGKENDSESRLDYYGACCYESWECRFVSNYWPSINFDSFKILHLLWVNVFIELLVGTSENPNSYLNVELLFDRSVNLCSQEGRNNCIPQKLC